MRFTSIKVIATLPLILAVFFITGPDRARGDDTVVIASFSTSIADQHPDVKRNITLAGNRLNGAVIYPGAVFSFNSTVGEGSAKNGFASGNVLYRGMVRSEPGGGICQVSSTLFNALLMAGFVIIERHRHYQPVTYVPAGLDATIKYGKKDLRMKNPHRQEVFLYASVNDKSISVQVRARRAPVYSYDLYTEEEDIEIPFEQDDRDIRKGLNVEVYRKKYRQGKLISSFLLYRDYYPPVYREQAGQ